MRVATTLPRTGWLWAAALALAAGGALTGAGGPALRHWIDALTTQRSAPARGAPVPADEVCFFAPALPFDPASGQPRLAPRPVPAQARCPVCGMFPARAAAWAAQVIYRDGDAHFFDSPLSLHLFLQDVGRYARGRSRQDLAALYVRDTEGGGWIDAIGAWHVQGSDALGPMRAGNLPAFASRSAAERFAQGHGGQVLAAAQIDAAVLTALDARSAARSGHAH
ncbi:nitrous oxide reductase accessory protein NosL [Ideonella sp. DXS22W]|uniref:Nitrous oxide reductase accessory protein NosL n=1 Tax=Pseudaquabacterium inlustre TaxID=2984192 RepID=A0ABU9CJC4_9BURK